MAVTREYKDERGSWTGSYRINKVGLPTSPVFRLDNRMVKKENVPDSIVKLISDELKELKKDILEGQMKDYDVFSIGEEATQAPEAPQTSQTPQTTYEQADHELADLMNKYEAAEQDKARLMIELAEVKQELADYQSMATQIPFDIHDPIYLAKQLVGVCGIYLPLLGRRPEPTEKSPITGDAFTQFTFGQSLQAYKAFEAKNMIEKFKVDDSVQQGFAQADLDEDVRLEAQKAFSNNGQTATTTQTPTIEIEEDTRTSEKGTITAEEFEENQYRAFRNNMISVKTMGVDNTKIEEYSGGAAEEPSPLPPINARGIPLKVFIDSNWAKTATISADGTKRIKPQYGER